MDSDLSTPTDDLTQQALHRFTPLFTDAARFARTRIEPEADIHASASYRRQLVEVLTRRVLVAAAPAFQPRMTAPGLSGNPQAGS